MKKALAVLMMVVLSLAVFASGSAESASSTELMLGMVTDSGTIDDRSFNQGTYEGVAQAADELGLQCTYLRPAGTTTTDYLTAISDLYDNGYRFIACPGYLFAEAVAQAQEMYPDLMLIIIDDALASGIGPNTVAITFKEQESGFMAGLATALKLQTGDVGFVGGLEIPAVQKFNWGFQQGVAYASVINEAKNRRLAGEDVWAVGVDVDQYSVGDMGNGESCILTSAMKDVTGVAYDQAMAAANGTFQGGTHLILGVAEGRAGIPATNPNLTPEIEETVASVAELIADGTIVIQDTADGLIP